VESKRQYNREYFNCHITGLKKDINIKK